jgi:NADPH:quinone reductase-like Zn-dependent oxidoreductase
LSTAPVIRQKANGDHLAAIAGLVVKGTVKVNVETVLPWAEARQAQELSKTGHSGEKIVLEV